jgi:hypothetical protein
LFASATRTCIGGLRVSMPPSQVPGRAAVWTCRLMMTLFSRMISSRRKEHSPIFVVARGADCRRWNAGGVSGQPGRKILRLAEGLGRRGQDREGRRDQGPDPRNCHQAPSHLVLFGSPRDLGIEPVDLRLQMGKSINQQHLQRCNGIGGQAAALVLDDGNQSRGLATSQIASA